MLRGVLPAPMIQDVGIALDELVASVENPGKELIFSTAGYGITDNAGGAGSDISLEEVRRYADHLQFSNLRSNTLALSQNSAKDDENNGACFGDSGGPIYFDFGNGEVVVAVTSAGDSVCRSTNVTIRMDTPGAIAMINCARAPSVTDDPVQEVIDCVNNINF